MGERSRRRRAATTENPRPAAPAATTPEASNAIQIAPFALLLAAVVVWVTGHMNPGVDTWLALAAGRHILAHGPALADPFSFASLPAGGSWWQPTGWVNQNWLSHAAIAWSARTFGTASLVGAKFLLYLAVALVSAANARVRGAGWRLGCLAAAAALACSRDWLEVRPADATNLAVAGLLLLIVVAGRRPARLWLAVPLVAVWCNAHGGFVFGLGVLGLLAAFAIAAQRWPQLGAGAFGWRLPLAVAAGAVAVAVLASPYRFSNLTHPLEVSAGPHAGLWRQVSEWRPLFDPAGVGQTRAYLLLVASTAAVLVVWLPDAVASARARKAPEALCWFDLAVLLVAVAMSLVSRRFVPLAALVLGPMAAGAAAAVWQRRGKWREATARFRCAGRVAAWVGACAAVVAVGRGAAAAYVAPWPPDARHASVFDRLTHTYLRPHGAMQFLAANGVEGRILVPWEEGGFVAAAQRPDPATGRVPLQVLIDGRAQEAFPASTLVAYQELVAGGPVAATLSAAARPPTDAEAAALRRWVEQRLEELGIGLVLVTPASKESVLALALFNAAEWHVVYLDEYHSLLASRRLAPALVAAVEAGTAAFPDGQAAALTRAYRGLRVGGAAGLDEAFRQAIAACEPVPSARAVGFGVQAAAGQAREAELRTWLAQLAERVLADRQRLSREDGYWRHLAAARVALGWLQEDAIRRGDGPAARWAGERLERTGADEQVLRRQVVW